MLRTIIAIALLTTLAAACSSAPASSTPNGCFEEDPGFCSEPHYVGDAGIGFTATRAFACSADATGEPAHCALSGGNVALAGVTGLASLWCCP